MTPSPFVSAGQADGSFHTLDALAAGDNEAELSEILQIIEPRLHELPYLGMGENEYIYRFRTAKERNSSVYVDGQSEALYVLDTQNKKLAIYFMNNARMEVMGIRDITYDLIPEAWSPRQGGQNPTPSDMKEMVKGG